MRYVNLPKLTTGVEFFDRALEQWQQAIERALSWDVKPGLTFKFTSGEGGQSLVVPAYGQCFSAVVTTAITARNVGGTALGVGKARLKTPTGVGSNVVDGIIVDVQSGFRVSIPVGTWIECVPHGATVYKMVGADCPV